MEEGLERLVAERAGVLARTRWDADLEDLPEDVQDELLEESEEDVRREVEAALDRAIESRIRADLERADAGAEP